MAENPAGFIEALSADAEINVGEGLTVPADALPVDILKERNIMRQFLSMDENKNWFIENDYSDQYSSLMEKKGKRSYSLL